MQCEEVAFECFARFSRGDSLKTLLFKSDSALLSSAKVALTNPAEFQDHLAKYGLAFATYRFENLDDHGAYRYNITLKEKEDVIN